MTVTEEYANSHVPELFEAADRGEVVDIVRENGHVCRLSLKSTRAAEKPSPEAA